MEYFSRATRGFFLARWLFLALGVQMTFASATDTSPSAVERITYHGWPDALKLANEFVEVIAVPEISRVMSFRFRDGENVFWENPSLAGKLHDPNGPEWSNFGGDKTWPAPESEWANVTKHIRWLPPRAFDGLPVSARSDSDSIVLISPVDAFYGIRIIRRISLQPHASTMVIETTYERVSGEPLKVGVWVITQFAEPVAVYLPVPPHSIFPAGYLKFYNETWPQLTVGPALLKLARDPNVGHKLGSDTACMLWVGETAMCLVSSPRVPGAEYADHGSNSEVFTNPNPNRYVELETLGPLATMKPGDRIAQTNTYRLFHRTRIHADSDASHALAELK